MQQTQHVVDSIYAYRFEGPKPSHALLIFHGSGGHGGIYNGFCAYHAAKGVDIWAFDAPGHGRTNPEYPRGTFTMEEWVAAGTRYGEYIHDLTGLPVFALGSSLGVAPAYSVLAAEVFQGAIMMGAGFIPGSPALANLRETYASEGVQQLIAQFGRAFRFDIDMAFDFDQNYGFKGAGAEKKRDPLNIWSYDLSSWASVFTYDPGVLPADNAKPILMAVGEKDPISRPENVKKIFDTIGGPTEFHIEPDAPHQLMLYKTGEFSRLAAAWVSKHLVH